MEKLDIYRHVFEAFSSLSDAQDLAAAGSVKAANDLINHAKLHLLAISDADHEIWRQAMSTGLGCSLAEEEIRNRSWPL